MGVSFPDRRTVLLGALAVALLAGAPARALEGIAVIDYQMIFDRYEGTADAQQTLNRDLKQWDEDAKAMRAEIEELKSELESQRLMLSEDRLKEKQTELENKQREYERFAQEIWGVNGKAATRNAELTAPIADKILDIIANLGDEMKLSIVLDAGTGGVVWAKDDVNITDVVLEDLQIAVQREKDSGTETPAESTPAPQSDGNGGAPE
jgi:outer membrane protein